MKTILDPPKDLINPRPTSPQNSILLTHKHDLLRRDNNSAYTCSSVLICVCLTGAAQHRHARSSHTVSAGHAQLLPANRHLGGDAFPAADDRNHSCAGLLGAHLQTEQRLPEAQVRRFYSVLFYSIPFLHAHLYLSRVCQVRGRHCGRSPPPLCCHGSLFDGQGRTQSSAVHLQPVDVCGLSDPDYDLPQPRPS